MPLIENIRRDAIRGRTSASFLHRHSTPVPQWARGNGERPVCPRIHYPFNSADAQTCTYGADDLSRIASVNCLSGSTNVWNQNFTYDAFGNITKQVPTGGTGISWIPGYNASTNRYTLGGTSYDADGNVTNDTFNTYTWDAEGKLLSEEGYTFIYDAFGHEAEWLSNGTYELSYITIGNYKLSAMGQSPWYAEYPYPGGSLTSEGAGLTAAQMADWLGTSRAVYSYTGGNWIKSIAHAPFGETYIGNSQNFTGQWSDADTVNTTYYFPERQYRSSQGRWLSPDPAGLQAADPSNPQSWNRYAYVLNNPLGNTDPTGLWCFYGSVGADGNPDPNEKDNFDSSNFDFNSTQDECEGHGGKWNEDVWSTTVNGDAPDDVATFYNGQQVFPQIVAANNGSWWSALTHSPWVVSWILPVYPVPVLGGIGPAGSLAWNPKTKNVCLSIGVGASAGHNVAGGPVAGTTLSGEAASPAQIDQILQGGSVNFGGNVPLGPIPAGPGGQVSVNGSGAVYGPTFGAMGLSLSSTYAGCAHY